MSREPPHSAEAPEGTYATGGAFPSTRIVSKGSSRGVGPAVKTGTVLIQHGKLERCSKCGGLRYGSGPHASRMEKAGCCDALVKLDCTGQMVNANHVCFHRVDEA